MAELITSLHVGWVKSKDSYIKNDHLLEIVNFFVWGTPCEFVSSSGQSMMKRGWPKNVWKSNDLRDFLLFVGNLKLNATYKKVKRLEEMSDAAISIGLGGKNFHTKRDSNRIAFFHGMNCAEMLSIFYYIRCAFAHGRFEMYHKNGETVYVMEAISKKRGSDDYLVKARLVLKEETLLKWKSVLMGGAESLKKAIEHMNEDIQQQIKYQISTNIIRKKEELIPLLSYEETQVFTQLNVMRNKNQVGYDLKGRRWIVTE